VSAGTERCVPVSSSTSAALTEVGLVLLPKLKVLGTVSIATQRFVRESWLIKYHWSFVSSYSTARYSAFNGL
jgi:hypothetical protein